MNNSAITFCTTNCRNREQPDFSERGRLNLLQQFKMYKVKTADLSMVFDGLDNLIRSNSVAVPISTNKNGRIQLYQPAWIEIDNDVGRSNSTPPSSMKADFKSNDDTKAKNTAKLFNLNQVSALPQGVVPKKSTKAPTLQQSSTYSTTPAPLQMIRRRKSAPRHRCNDLNRSLSSILKPSVHSFPKKDERLTRSLPPNSTAGLASDVLDEVVVDEVRLCMSITDMDSGLLWVPKGVQFSLNVEAYFYRA